MLTRLTQVTVDRGDGVETGLEDHEIAGFAGLLGGAGAETVTKLVGNAVVLFDEHPDQWRRVAGDPGCIPQAVEEILRLLPPSQYQGRFSVEERAFEGGTLPAGFPVLLLTGAATRDPRAFERPDDFDIDRPPSVSIGFGHGVHSCLGAALARMESRIAIEEIAARWQPARRRHGRAAPGQHVERRRLRQRARHRGAVTDDGAWRGRGRGYAFFAGRFRACDGRRPRPGGRGARPRRAAGERAAAPGFHPREPPTVELGPEAAQAEGDQRVDLGTPHAGVVAQRVGGDEGGVERHEHEGRRLCVGDLDALRGRRRVDELADERGQRRLRAGPRRRA